MEIFLLFIQTIRVLSKKKLFKKKCKLTKLPKKMKIYKKIFVKSPKILNNAKSDPQKAKNQRRESF